MDNAYGNDGIFGEICNICQTTPKKFHMKDKHYATYINKNSILMCDQCEDSFDPFSKQIDFKKSIWSICQCRNYVCCNLCYHKNKMVKLPALTLPINEEDFKLPVFR